MKPVFGRLFAYPIIVAPWLEVVFFSTIKTAVPSGVDVQRWPLVVAVLDTIRRCRVSRPEPLEVRASEAHLHMVLGQAALALVVDDLDKVGRPRARREERLQIARRDPHGRLLGAVHVFRIGIDIARAGADRVVPCWRRERPTAVRVGHPRAHLCLGHGAVGLVINQRAGARLAILVGVDSKAGRCANQCEEEDDLYDKIPESLPVQGLRRFSVRIDVEMYHISDLIAVDNCNVLYCRVVETAHDKTLHGEQCEQHREALKLTNRDPLHNPPPE